MSGTFGRYFGRCARSRSPRGEVSTVDTETLSSDQQQKDRSNNIQPAEQATNPEPSTSGNFGRYFGRCARSRSPRGVASTVDTDKLSPGQQQKDRILVIDFGSHLSHLVCRRVREANVYCELRPCSVVDSEVEKFKPTGIILCGGPHSVHDADEPHLDPEVWQRIAREKLPTLGICYGFQEMCRLVGGQIEPGTKREFGKAMVNMKPSELFHGIDVANLVQVWMSHGDKLTELPKGFQAIADIHSCKHVAVEDVDRRMWGVQFHPEVTHTPCGAKIIQNFVIHICGCKGTWNMKYFKRAQIASIRYKLGDKIKYCVGAVSGGVISSVEAALLHHAFGKDFRPFLVDTGCLRKDEASIVKARLEKLGLKLQIFDAKERFYSALAGKTEPEAKRKIILKCFEQAVEQAVEDMKLPPEQCMLSQGTLYSDVIESTPSHGSSTSSKSHHNGGGLSERLKMGLLEPLGSLFKDEVRSLGRELDLAEESLMRHPFPGPGLGIRIIGEVTAENVETLQLADDIYIEELRKTGHYNKIGQAFAVLMPTGNENVCALRAVTTSDLMTADWYDMPHDVLKVISNRILNEVKGINRVCYDVSSKPHTTIEWQ